MTKSPRHRFHQPALSLVRLIHPFFDQLPRTLDRHAQYRTDCVQRQDEFGGVLAYLLLACKPYCIWTR